MTGDRNTVTLTFGASGISIPLVRKQFPPPERRRRPAAGEPPRELDLLVPETGRLPLIGRQDRLAELRAWLDAEVDLSVHALIGPAGSGKTRLAIGLSQAIDGDPGDQGEWIAGFLSAGDLSAVVESLAIHSFAWERQTLLVVDNAAQCHQVVARWLDRLSSQKLDGKLRILLLDREAPEGFGWWHELTGSSPPARRGLFYTPRPQHLPEVSALEERRELISAALQAARELRGGAPSGPPIPAKGEDPDFDRRLAEPQFGNPLALVMAGVIAADRGPQTAMALRHLEAARQLGRRELDRMAALAESRRVSGDAMRHIGAFNGLVGGIPVAHLRRMIRDELAASHRSAELDAVLTLLEQELPPRGEGADAARQPRLATIQPDLIGEAVIIEAFTGRVSSEAEADEVVRRAYGLGLEEAARVLVRLVQDFGYPLEDESATAEEKSTARRVMDWLLNLMGKVEDPEHLLPLVNALPVHTTILREPAAKLTETLVKSERTVSNRAAALRHNLAVRLSALGRHEDALTAAEEAVRLYRALAAWRPATFIPDLAGSLNNMANIQSALGRHEEALTAAEEAFRLYCDLFTSRPDTFTPDLARSLNTLATMLSALGRGEEALSADKEAVRLCRTLTTPRPEDLTAVLAGSLDNIAVSLNDVGRHEEALTAAHEAVWHHRALAASRPDAFTPNLARSLNNLANSLSCLGRHEEALDASEEAVRLFRPLAASRPQAFNPELAGSLTNIVPIFSNLAQNEQAVKAAKEAVCLYRGLAAARPDAFTPELAGSLSNCANTLRAFGRREEALTAAEKAVCHYRALAAARPEAFGVDLARSLWVVGDLHGETRKSDTAIVELAESIRLLSPIFVGVPAAVAEMMRGVVQSYLTQCEAARREPDAEMLGPVKAVFERLNSTELQK